MIENIFHTAFLLAAVSVIIIDMFPKDKEPPFWLQVLCVGSVCVSIPTVFVTSLIIIWSS